MEAQLPGFVTTSLQKVSQEILKPNGIMESFRSGMHDFTFTADVQASDMLCLHLHACGS